MVNLYNFLGSILNHIAPQLPSVVDMLAENVTSTSFILTWCHPTVKSTSTPYTAYVLEYWETDSSSPPCSISLAGRVKKHTLTGLKPQTTYFVKMAAENVAGRGPFCEPLLVQTEPDGEYLPITVYMVLGELILNIFVRQSLTTEDVLPLKAFISCIHNSFVYSLY